eukprot:g3246.t1
MLSGLGRFLSDWHSEIFTELKKGEDFLFLSLLSLKDNFSVLAA